MDVKVYEHFLAEWCTDETLPMDHLSRYSQLVYPDWLKTLIDACPELAVNVPEAKEIIASGQAELISVRSWTEYIGEVSGYNYMEKKGRISSSVFGTCGTDAYHMENYRNLDHTTREYHEIEGDMEIGRCGARKA